MSEHRSSWVAMMSVSVKIDCTAQRLNERVQKVRSTAAGGPLTTDIAAKLKTQERENWELRQADEILP